MPDIPRAAAIRGRTTVEYGASGEAHPQYAASEVTKDVHRFVSRPVGVHADRGPHFAIHEIVGVASNTEQWHPLRGTFEVDASAPMR